ncbi:flagellar basal-body MS-ring/collar protein FliF [Nocardioides sp. CER19]|uniref:flagellar basal-body MS-ring/collar protein FliF n=1 Tax=Nocardioides sp. CER19 TaxID=3038538 RepID=UPI00244AB209|nr:flagellar basal-body MS-ring/collar protein FliF [Nocardioides sp. CER19]MDH2414631.1 flagellar basal-body MS-ring/collar protein FliF [Nocardioides sp. CER19]
MRDNLTRTLTRYTRAFADFTTGQKAVALIGTAALLLGGFLVFRWAAAPTYAPLYSSLSGEDASAVVDELDKEGVKYQLSNGGTTVMVPQGQVYSARIALSGKGLPSSDDNGYSLLDNESLSTSDFQEQNDFKRAMEGELSKTIEAINGVDTAVVHLALPEKKVFSDEQDPATASVLVKTRVGTTLSDEQVQAIVHLVASSIDGLDPKNVTVADASGKVLTLQDDTAAGAASTRMQQVTEFQDQMKSNIQAVLDRVVGPGHSTVNLTADLDFDQTTTKTKRYIYDPKVPPLSQTEQTEKYNGTNGSTNSAAGGVVGPDGQMDSSTTSSSPSTYENGTKTQDNAVGSTEEDRVAAPGGVKSLHVGVVLDASAIGTIQPQDIRNVIAAATGINTNRGDTIDVSSMAFDHTAEQASAKELAQAEAADKSAQRMKLYRNIGLGAVVALMILFAWIRARRRSKAREQATSYVVEQLRSEAAARAEAQELAAAQLLNELEPPMLPNPADEIRDELNALVERQPDDVAALLRGWLVEPKS